MLVAAKDKIVILISHKLSTILSEDKIFLFDKGQIIESGTYNELIKMKDKYEEMFTLQDNKYGMCSALYFIF